jgi:hypothetical protein
MIPLMKSTGTKTICALKWGKKAFRQMTEGNPESSCSDCPLAAIQIEQGTGRRPLNPIQILVRSYRGESIVDQDHTGQG